VAEREGIELLFIGGFGLSASLMGVPDLNLLTLTEMAEAIRRICGRVNVPVIADGDTGHGGVHNVSRTVREFEAAGASGLILEDQKAPKRCGHFQGKEVIPAEEMAIKIRAAASSRRRADFVIVARTDARQTHGLAEAIRRVNLYHKAGADIAFIEAPQSVEELALIPRRVNAPVLANMLTGGSTPVVPASQLEKWGFKIAVYPIESLLGTAAIVSKIARGIVQRGSVEGVLPEMLQFKEIKSMLGLQEFLSRQDSLTGRKKRGVR